MATLDLDCCALDYAACQDFAGLFKDAEEVGRRVGLPPGRVSAIYQDIERKRVATRYLHLTPVLVKEVPEIVLDATTIKDSG